MTSQPSKLTSLACDAAIWAILYSWSTYVLASHTYNVVTFFFFQQASLWICADSANPTSMLSMGLGCTLSWSWNPIFYTIQTGSCCNTNPPQPTNGESIIWSEQHYWYRARKAELLQGCPQWGYCQLQQGKGETKVSQNWDRTEQNRTGCRTRGSLPQWWSPFLHCFLFPYDTASQTTCLGFIRS
jgi:hypothetical protein